MVKNICIEYNLDAISLKKLLDNQIKMHEYILKEEEEKQQIIVEIQKKYAAIIEIESMRKQTIK
jgi:hypothetical protein